MAVDYTIAKPVAGTSRATSPTETEILTDVSDTVADIDTRITALDPVRLDLPIVVAEPSSAVGTWPVAPDSGQILAGFRYNSTVAQNDALIYDVVLGAGTWTLDLSYVRGDNTGIVTVQLDDGAGSFTTLGTIDTYNAAFSYNQTFTIAGIVIGSSIKRSMKLLVASKNASSSAYRASLSNLSMRRTA